MIYTLCIKNASIGDESAEITYFEDISVAPYRVNKIERLINASFRRQLREEFQTFCAKQGRDRAGLSLERLF